MPTFISALGRALRRLGIASAANSPPPDQGDAFSNIAYNRHRWGDARRWVSGDAYGYQWGAGYEQTNSSITRFSERFLLPHLGDRRDLKILELAPGAGRFTAELIRLSREIHLVDLNEACIAICKERFKYFPNVRYYVNDGLTCDVVSDRDFDLIASFDSMVHMAPDVIESYLADFAERIKPGGLVWLDHSGKGPKEAGHRTDMTDEKMARFARDKGFEVVAQHFRNDHDCISVLEKT